MLGQTMTVSSLSSINSTWRRSSTSSNHGPLECVRFDFAVQTWRAMLVRGVCTMTISGCDLLKCGNTFLTLLSIWLEISHIMWKPLQIIFWNSLREVRHVQWKKDNSQVVMYPHQLNEARAISVHCLATQNQISTLVNIDTNYSDHKFVNNACYKLVRDRYTRHDLVYKKDFHLKRYKKKNIDVFCF